MNKSSNTVSKPEVLGPHLKRLMKKRAIHEEWKKSLGALARHLLDKISIIRALNSIGSDLQFEENLKLFSSMCLAISKGDSLSSCLSGKIPPLDLALIDIGEQTGKLCDMLSKIAGLEDYKMPVDDVQMFLVSHLGILLDAGLPLVSSLEVVKEIVSDDNRGSCGYIFDDLICHITNGSTLDEALHWYGTTHFDEDFIFMVKRGFTAGNLEVEFEACRVRMMEEYDQNGFL